MNLRELIDSVEKTAKNSRWVDVGEIAEEVGISAELLEYDQNDLECYATKAIWMCTDTIVGIHAYYLFGELVFITAQQARKSDEEFEWVSTEAKEKVRAWVITKIASPPDFMKIIDWDADVSSWVQRGENYNVWIKNARTGR